MNDVLINAGPVTYMVAGLKFLPGHPVALTPAQAAMLQRRLPAGLAGTPLQPVTECQAATAPAVPEVQADTSAPTALPCVARESEPPLMADSKNGWRGRRVRNTRTANG